MHAYICECSARRCRRRIYLKPSEYAVLARIGCIVSADCMARERRTLVARYNGYRVVVMQNAGKAHV